LFILGPGTTYPAHAHPAEEFYIVLAGSPEFQVGANNTFERQRLGSIVLHHSEVSHSIRTKAEPFFAIFGWRGDIEARSWYRDDMANSNDHKRYPTIRKA
jgi:quercetin dioxygenase-like cupin family protein